MRPFGQPSGTLRTIAALVSLALTAAIFLLLRATSLPSPARRTEVQVAVTVYPMLPVRSRTGTAPALAAAAGPTAGLRSSPALRPRSSTVTPRAEELPAVASLGTAASAAVEAPPASAPLRIDAQTIRRAIAGSDGDLRRMARNSGAEVDSPRASRSEGLADSIAEKGVPDCLAPNGGGSLLSAPILLVLAIQGKCK